MQAKLTEHSELTMHSGRQDGGDPIYSKRQVHTAWPLTLLHLLFGPHGDGIQGSRGGESTLASSQA